MMKTLVKRAEEQGASGSSSPSTSFPHPHKDRFGIIRPLLVCRRALPAMPPAACPPANLSASTSATGSLMPHTPYSHMGNREGAGLSDQASVIIKGILTKEAAQQAVRGRRR
jgi:hypothetical protein